MEPEKGKEESGRPVGRWRLLLGWLIHHPRRAVRWLIGLAGRSVWLTAGAAYLGSSFAARVSGVTMQPLTAGHQLTALQATTVISLFTMPIYGMVMIVGRRRLTEPKLRDAVPDTKWRDRIFSRVLRAVRKLPLVHACLSRIVKTEKRHGWVLTFLPYLAVGFIGAVLGQYYAARIPLASGVAIGTLGPIAVTMWFAWHRRLKGLALFLPLLSAAGSMMFIPWGHHLDGAGVLAAVAGAVVSAIGVFTGKAVSNSGILLKTMTLSMTVGLLMGASSLLTVHWTWWIVLWGIIAGVLNAGSCLLYWVAMVQLHCPKRVTAAMGATAPALGGLVGLLLLHQALGLVSLVGIFLVLVSAVLNAVLTGSEEELAAEKRNHHTERRVRMANAHSGAPDAGAPDRRPQPRPINKRPGQPGWRRRRRTSARVEKD